MPEPMIAQPEDYFRALVPSRAPLLTDLEAEAAAEEIPIIGPLVGQLLFLLTRITSARRVLELGAATGYSAIWLGEACRETGGEVLTLEHSPELAVRARRNLKTAGLSDRVTVQDGDAISIMGEMEGPFDLIFTDIDKEFYGPALPHCSRLLRPGGLLVADNTGFRDADDFNRTIAASPAWLAVNLYLFLPFHSPEHDGLCLALRR